MDGAETSEGHVLLFRNVLVHRYVEYLNKWVGCVWRNEQAWVTDALL